jgi:hypothetical protein
MMAVKDGQNGENATKTQDTCINLARSPVGFAQVTLDHKIINLKIHLQFTENKEQFIFKMEKLFMTIT